MVTAVESGATTELRHRVRDIAHTWFENPRHEPVADGWLRGFEPEFSKQLSAAGLIGLTWPHEYGGQGASNVERLAVTEELLRAGAPSAAHWSSERQIGPSLLRHGTAEARTELLPKIISVDAIFCLGMSEETAGSDLAAVKSRATRVDGGWTITGRKMWTGHAHKATHAYVLARTSDGERKQQGLSEFLVDMDQPGVTVTPIINISGEHRFNQVDFVDAFVPEYRLLGEEGNGWRQVVEQLSFERGGSERYLSSYLLLTTLIERAGDSKSAHVDHVIGDLSQRLAVLRRLGWQVANALDRGEAPVKQAAALKLLGNQFEVAVIDSLRSVIRPEDLARDSLYSTTLQSSPGFEIRGGSVEVLLSLIAKLEAQS